MRSFIRFIFMISLLGMATGLLIVTASNLESENGRKAAMERDRAKLADFLASASAADRLRYAEIVVEDQTISGDERVLKSTLLWCPYAWDDQGNSVALPQRRVYTQGNQIFVDGLLVEFPRGIDEAGYLKGVALCVFEHVYGEGEKPDEKTILASWGLVRRGYRPDPLNVTVLDRYVWQRIGEIVTSHPVAESRGARVTLFPPVSAAVKPGWLYTVSIGSKMQLDIRQEEQPRRIGELIQRMRDAEKEVRGK